MERRALLLVMAAGCRQIFGLDTPTTAADARVDGVMIDGPRDAQGGTCVDRWRQGPQFAPIAPLAGVNTATQDHAPFVTADDLTLYFVHDGDFWTSTRIDPQATFGAGARDDLSSGTNDFRIFVASDQLQAFLASNRGGGTGGTDLWRAFRNTINEAWQLDQMYLANVIGVSDQSDPFLSDDLLHIYYVVKGNGGGNGRDIMMATRPDAAKPFDNAILLPAINSGTADDEQPALSKDELVIVFSSRRSGNGDLWYATRSDTAKTFDTPQPLTVLNSPQRIDEGPFLTADACTLYFASDRGGGMDIYVTTLLD